MMQTVVDPSKSEALYPTSVRPELVEGPFFLKAGVALEDKSGASTSSARTVDGSSLIADALDRRTQAELQFGGGCRTGRLAD